MANSKRTYNKTISANLDKNGVYILTWESWKSVSEESLDRENITTNQKMFPSIEELLEFVENKYRMKPTDQEIVESCLRAIGRQAKKAWMPLQRITKEKREDSPFNKKVYEVLKNAYVYFISTKSGFDFSKLLGVNPAKLTQYDPTPNEVAELAKV